MSRAPSRSTRYSALRDYRAILTCFTTPKRHFALRATLERDSQTLLEAGYAVEMRRQTPAFGEALVSQNDESVEMQWARDSAFRFFPLIEHPDFGLVLHPFDAATNKVLALVGRLEARDWIDTIECDARLQPLGFLSWAASGKDPGFSPPMILEEAARSSRYSAVEIAALEFEGESPNVALLSQTWKAMLRSAHEIVRLLPTQSVGRYVLNSRNELFRGDVAALRSALSNDELRFHEGTIGGVWPNFR